MSLSLYVVLIGISNNKKLINKQRKTLNLHTQHFTLLTNIKTNKNFINRNLNFLF